MPRFSEYFELGLSQHQLDFVDVSNTHDTPVYVDPYAIEVRNDVWAAQASERIRVFFEGVLNALRADDLAHAEGLMAHLHEPRETFLGVSSGQPKGRGVGTRQARDLIDAIRRSRAFKTGLLEDLSEMSLYVEGIDRDKISDLTTNVIRDLLVTYTQQQCELYDIQLRPYSGPPLWDSRQSFWVSREVHLPFIQDSATILVPKYIVRRSLSLDSQEFYNKQITDFLVAENLRANSSLVRSIKRKKGRTERKVYKKDVREKYPKSKSYIADIVSAHPELLQMFKEIASRHSALSVFDDGAPSVSVICEALSKIYPKVPKGKAHAETYHQLVLGSLTALFYPSLIQPHKEWDIHGGRKRIDLVFTNAADGGFFGQRRDDNTTNANVVIVECKNYTDDLANPEMDQLLGRFDHNRGKLGIITCRSIDDPARLKKRCLDASSRSQGYILVLTDADIVKMLELKAKLDDKGIEEILFLKFRELLA